MLRVCSRVDVQCVCTQQRVQAGCLGWGLGRVCATGLGVNWVQGCVWGLGEFWVHLHWISATPAVGSGVIRVSLGWNLVIVYYHSVFCVGFESWCVFLH